MANERRAIKAVLTGSVAWAALVTGGTYLLDDLLPTGLTPSNAQYDPTSGDMLLHAVITFTASNRKELLKRSQRRFFSIWLYGTGFDDIDAAVLLAKQLLDRKEITADDRTLCWTHEAGDDGPQFNAEELNYASAQEIRFYVDGLRKET